MSDRPAVSVVLATRNRERSLRLLLQRLERLSPPLDWELVVADNGSTDATGEALSSAGRLPLRTVREPVAGKSRALNKALGAARGDLVVFTDDDVEPLPGWLEELVAAALRHPDVDCFGGRIRIAEGRMPAWVRESRNLQEILASEHDYGELERPYPPNRFPIGPNMAVRRRAVERVSEPWPVDLGPGSPLPVGDEKAFWLRLGEGGGKPRIYVPSSVVLHHPEALDIGLSAALKRCYRGGFSGALVERRHRQAAEPGAEGPGALAMLAQTRSASELLCVAARALGYAMGRVA